MVHVQIIESGNLQFKVYIEPRGNDEKVGAEDEGAPVGKEMRFAHEVKPTIMIGKGFSSMNDFFVGAQEYYTLSQVCQG